MEQLVETHDVQSAGLPTTVGLVQAVRQGFFFDSLLRDVHTAFVHMAEIFHRFVIDAERLVSRHLVGKQGRLRQLLCEVAVTGDCEMILRGGSLWDCELVVLGFLRNFL